MRAPCRGLSCLIAILISFSSHAQDSTSTSTAGTTASAHFAAGSRAFESGDYARALESFRAAIAAGSTGPAAHYNAAVAEFRLGNYAAAETRFRALGRDFPEMAALADYNLGLALLQQDREEPAREAMQRAAEADDERVAALALAMLERLPGDSPPPEPRRWLRVFEAGLGQDDNVVLADPLGLPAGQSADSGFAEIAFYADGPVSPNDAWRLGVNAYLVDYPDAPDYNQTALLLAAMRESDAGAWTLTAGPRIGRSTIGGDGFEQYVGIAAEMRRPLPGAGASLTIGLSLDAADEIDSRFAYIDGDRSALSLRLDKALERATLILDYRRSADDRAGAGVSARHDRYRATWRRPWGPRWSSDVVVEIRDTTYHDLEPPRDEDRLQSGLRAQRRLIDGWLLNLRYGYADNDSSDSLYSYERSLLAVGASRTF